jgi:type VI secretion system protein VasD
MFKIISMALFLLVLQGCSAVEQTTGISLGNKETTLTVTLTAAADINPDLNNKPSPVLIRLFFLTARSNFDNSSYDALFDQADGGLAGEFLTVRDVLLVPGSQQQLKLEQNEQVAFVGVVAGYRQLDAIRWRDAISSTQASFLGKSNLRIQVDAQAVRILE